MDIPLKRQSEFFIIFLKLKSTKNVKYYNNLTQNFAYIA